MFPIVGCALLLFAVACSSPLLALEIGNNHSSTSLTGTSLALWYAGQQGLALGQPSKLGESPSPAGLAKPEIERSGVA